MRFRRCSNLHLKYMGGEVIARQTLLHGYCESEHVLTVFANRPGHGERAGRDGGLSATTQLAMFSV